MGQKEQKPNLPIRVIKKTKEIAQTIVENYRSQNALKILSVPARNQRGRK